MLTKYSNTEQHWMDTEFFIYLVRLFSVLFGVGRVHSDKTLSRKQSSIKVEPTRKVSINKKVKGTYVFSKDFFR
jgi:hypothetical protein